MTWIQIKPLVSQCACLTLNIHKYIYDGIFTALNWISSAADCPEAVSEDIGNVASCLKEARLNFDDFTKCFQWGGHSHKHQKWLEMQN